MKRYFSIVFLFLLISVNVNTQTPTELYGIWKGDDRYIFFGTEGQVSVILKEYYGWYYDRAAEPEEDADTKHRNVNAASSPEAQHITAEYSRLQDDLNAWEISISYDKKNISIIPAAVLDGKLYLNFLIRTKDDLDKIKMQTDSVPGSENSKAENIYWQGINSADSIRIFERENKENINSWYITENAVYKLRFWQTDMDYDEYAAASFTDGDNVFTLKKHIKSAGQTYTSASGRGKIIRNVEKYRSLPFSAAIYSDSDGIQRLCVSGKPYLEKVESAGEKEELFKIIKEANSRRKPNSPPLFKPKTLDWHWEMIEKLGKVGDALLESHNMKSEQK